MPLCRADLVIGNLTQWPFLARKARPGARVLKRVTLRFVHIAVAVMMMVIGTALASGLI